jgi:membrane-bound lytic murein transglycosylase C
MTTIPHPLAPLIVGFVLAPFIIGAPSAKAGDPLAELDTRYQQHKAAGEQALLDVQQQYRARRAATEALWVQHEQAVAARWAQIKREIEVKWDKVRQSTAREWVEYSSSYEARSTVDFVNGVIEITALVPIGEQGSSHVDPASVIVAMRALQAAFASTGSPSLALATAADPASLVIARAALPSAWAKIVQQFQRIVSREAKAGRPVLANQVVDQSGKPVAAETAQPFLESEILPHAVVEKEPMHGRDGVTRAQVTAKVRLAPDHLRQRALLYRDDVLTHARRHGLDPRLLFAIIHTESYFNPLAETPTPAYGLMLLVPRGPARDAYNYLYHDDIVLDGAYLQDPTHNIELGAAYLHLLRRQLLPTLEQNEKTNYLLACAYTWGLSPTRDHILRQAHIEELTPTQLFALLTQKTPEETRIYLTRIRDRLTLYDSLSPH